MLLFLASLSITQEEDGTPDQNAEKEEQIQVLVDQLSADERPTRQQAASKLILIQSNTATKKVSTLLHGGSEVEKEALLTAIADKVGDDRSISHLLNPLLHVFAREGNGEDKALVEAISYFPDDFIIKTIKKLLKHNDSVEGVGPSISLFTKARLIRLTGRKQLKLNPMKVSKMLFSVSETLPGALRSEILVALQEIYHFYSFTTFDQWSEWWEKAQDQTEAERYRDLLQHRADRQLKEWTDAVDRLFSLAGNQNSTPDLSQLLQTQDPRKLSYVLQKIRENAENNGSAPDPAPLLTRLSEQNPPRVQKELIQTAGTLGLQEAREKIETFIDHYRPSLRKVSAEALGQIGNEASGKLLSEQFQNEKNDAVLIALLGAFRELDYRQEIFKIHDKLLNSTDLSSSVRNEIISTLGYMGEEKSLSILKTQLKNSEPEEDVTLRFNIALSIGQIGSVKGVPSLIELTKAPTPSVRGAAAQALGNISFDESGNTDDTHQQSLDALFKLLRQAEDPTVKRRAAKSIAKIARPETPERLAEIIVRRENGAEEVIKKALKDSLKSHPGKLVSVVSILQKAGNHSLVTELASVKDQEHFKELDSDQRLSLRLDFVRSFLEEEDWSTAISLLDDIESQEISERSDKIAMFRIRANIGLGNYSKARSRIESLLENTDEPSDLLWDLRYQKARLLYEEGPPERAISFIRETLRPKSPPETISKKLKKIEDRHKTVRKQIDKNLSLLLAQKADGDQGTDKERVQQLLEYDRYYSLIVNYALKKLTESDKPAVEVVTPKLVELLNSITGTSHSANELTDTEAVINAMADWRKWVNEQKLSSDSASSEEN